MKLSDLYRRIVRIGMARDPRSRRDVLQDLARAKKEYRRLAGIDKRSYDRERLKNPYADTRILYGDPDTELRTVAVGIDMETPEIVACDSLRQRGRQIDLVLAHHPEGVALNGLHDVMRLQSSIFTHYGVRSDISSDLMKERIDEVSRSLAPLNHSRSVDMARVLEMPFMCAHTPADNCVVHYLTRFFARTRPKRLADVVMRLKSIPEYADACAKNNGPHILVGDGKKSVGKIFVDMTGGTEGPKRIFSRLSQAGVGTIIAMHLSEEHFKHAKSEYINVVIAGHIASDNLGMNLLLDAVDHEHSLELIACSGFLRVRR